MLTRPVISLYSSADSRRPNVSSYNGCYLYPRESEGICFHRRWFVCVCVCVSVCLSVTTITKKCGQICTIFYAKVLRGKGRPSSCFVTIVRGMWK